MKVHELEHPFTICCSACKKYYVCKLLKLMVTVLCTTRRPLCDHPTTAPSSRDLVRWKCAQAAAFHLPLLRLTMSWKALIGLGAVFLMPEDEASSINAAVRASQVLVCISFIDAYGSIHADSARTDSWLASMHELHAGPLHLRPVQLTCCRETPYVWTLGTQSEAYETIQTKSVQSWLLFYAAPNAKIVHLYPPRPPLCIIIYLSRCQTPAMHQHRTRATEVNAFMPSQLPIAETASINVAERNPTHTHCHPHPPYTPLVASAICS